MDKKQMTTLTLAAATDIVCVLMAELSGDVLPERLSMSDKGNELLRETVLMNLTKGY